MQWSLMSCTVALQLRCGKRRCHTIEQELDLSWNRIAGHAAADFFQALSSNGSLAVRDDKPAVLSSPRVVLGKWLAHSVAEHTGAGPLIQFDWRRAP